MYAMSFAQVGNNIQKALSARGLTQQTLAERLGISKQVMSKIVNGYKAINVNELSRIASVLGVSTDELLAAGNEAAPALNLAFMGSITNKEAKEKVELLRIAIDQIQLLEDLVNE